MGVGVVATSAAVPLLAWRFDAFEGSFAPLYHPGSMLLFGFVAGAAWQRPAAPGRCSPPSWACSGPS